MIEDGVVKGVVLGRDKVMPNEYLEGEVLEADCVISTLPVWNVLRVVPESALPDWYVDQIRFVAQDRCGSPGSGSTSPREEPVTRSTRARSRPGCTRRPRRLSGFAFNQSAMDPTTAPEGIT